MVSLITAFITVVLLYGSYSIYASSDEDLDLDLDSRELDFKDRAISLVVHRFDRYNAKMNVYFNEKVERLNAIIDGDEEFDDGRYGEIEDFFTHEDFVVPPDIDPVTDDVQTILEKCGDKNVSTYCVSIGALAIHMDYVRFLKGRLGELEIPPDGVFTSIELLGFTTRKNERIHEEIENSRKVMKASVAIYNEYKLAYPMHKKYREIIRLLSQYRTVMKDISHQTAQYPIKFINVTTTRCD